MRTGIFIIQKLWAENHDCPWSLSVTSLDCQYVLITENENKNPFVNDYVCPMCEKDEIHSACVFPINCISYKASTMAVMAI